MYEGSTPARCRYRMRIRCRELYATRPILGKAHYLCRIPKPQPHGLHRKSPIMVLFGFADQDLSVVLCLQLFGGAVTSLNYVDKYSFLTAQPRLLEPRGC